ncbi:MAG: hypothetical protein U1F61_22800 [Opitutaceae bacterium]
MLRLVHVLRFFRAAALLLAASVCSRGADSPVTSVLDTLILGDPTSERAHGFSQIGSEVLAGGLGEPARRLLPLAPISHNGGSIRFTLKVDPAQTIYLTVKLWGSDRGAAAGRLLLFLDGQQVGYRHEGDHDVLNQSDDEPAYLGRFLYQTVTLPPMLTRGRTTVELTIAGLGPMWPYGSTFAQKQRAFSQPSRGIYRVVTHTAACFTPDPSEKQGPAGGATPRPGGPGEELIATTRATVNARLTRLLEEPVGGGGTGPADGRILLLAEAYLTPWTTAYHDPRAIAGLVRAGDRFLRPGVIGQPWVGAGPLGEAIARVGPDPALLKALDEAIEVPSGFPFLPEQRGLEPGEELAAKPAAPSGSTVRLSRREAWSQVLRASVDWNRLSGRRFYTNQSMIVDHNIYTANRGLQVIAPSLALPEEQARRYLYEAIGVRPWLGNDRPEGGSAKPYGDGYYQVTRKGLSRELGYVGTYGETILTFTRDMAELTGDEKIRAQLLRLQAARLVFRYPSLDGDGYRVMKLASEIDSRTAHFPLSQGAYGIAHVREAWWMELPAFLQDPMSVGAVQQCLEDNQYFQRLDQRAKDNDTRGMMRNATDYAVVKALPKSAYRLPMTEGQPDFVFSDEENAVLAIKHGEQRLFFNFYFRQEFGVSGVVRILDVAPTVMRIATVKSQFQVVSSGREWTRPDVIDFQRSGGMPPPGESLHQAWRGETLPIAERPAGASRPEYGKWGPFVGKAAFYWLRYGDYLVAINTTETTTHSLPLPAGQARALDLVSGKTVPLGSDLPVGPLTSVVLYLGK